MPIDDNIQDLENEILNRTEYMDKGVQKEIINFVGDLQQRLILGGTRRPGFKTRTGNLRRSMGVNLTGDSLIVSMLIYGWYLTFGVNGKKRSNAFGLSEEVAKAFGVNKGYEFGSDKVPGIDPFDFYPRDIQDKLLEILNYDGRTT